MLFEFMRGAFYLMCGVACIYIAVVMVTATIKSINEALRGRKQ